MAFARARGRIDISFGQIRKILGHPGTRNFSMRAGVALALLSAKDATFIQVRGDKPVGLSVRLSSRPRLMAEAPRLAERGPPALGA